jgi:hypothetical protein
MAKPFQFDLRTLLLAVVPVAIFALPVGMYLRRPQPVPVSGTVTLDGKPLRGARVAFNGREARSSTNAKGFFKLLTWNGRSEVDWVIPGSYKITVVNIRVMGKSGPRKNMLPERYASGDTSGLTAEVTRDGPNVFAFNLTTPEE